MKKILKSLLASTLLTLGSMSLYAGPGTGHSHTHVAEKVTEAKAILIAKSMRDGLVKKGTISKKWSEIENSNITKKSFGEVEEWVISFFNPDIEDKTKQTLYVFVSLYGKVTGANYTGN